MEKLAVIVPIYNMELYLGECIESICAQTYTDLQIILVDDGSTDKSGSLCDEYAKKDKRILVIHQKNLGKLKARYNGLSVCTCRYVTFVDADDWIDANTYELASNYIQRGIDVIVFGKILEKGEKGRTFPESNYAFGEYNRADIEEKIYPSIIWDFHKNKIGMTQSLCDKIFKKDLMLKSYSLARELGELNYAEDSLILYPLMQWVYSMYILEDNPYHYRKTSDDIPVYVCKDDFFSKLYTWYEYLVQNVKLIPNACKQIDYLYISLAETRKEYYGDIASMSEYMFPFHMVPSGSKIILWGAGKVGKIYREQIDRLSYCTITAWVDKNYQNYSQWGVQNVDIVNKESDYDYIVIAIFSEAIKDTIVLWLKEQGISGTKIIWYKE